MLLDLLIWRDLNLSSIVITQSLQFYMNIPCFIWIYPGLNVIFSFFIFATNQFNPCSYFFGAFGAWGFGTTCCAAVILQNKLHCCCCCCGCCVWGVLDPPDKMLFQFSVPFELYINPIGNYALVNPYKILKAFPTLLYQSLCGWILFFWNFIAWKSAA